MKVRAHVRASFVLNHAAQTLVDIPVDQPVSHLVLPRVMEREGASGRHVMASLIHRSAHFFEDGLQIFGATEAKLLDRIRQSGEPLLVPVRLFRQSAS